MVTLYTLRFQRFPSVRVLYLLFLVFFLCPVSWASRPAMVIVDKAIIYADTEMSSPVGYIRKGKKIVVGEISRNKAQVYPIIVSGKIAYIRVLDVTTEAESMDSKRLVAERFRRNAQNIYKTKYVMSYYSFSSQIKLADSNGSIVDKDLLRWHGFSLKGEVLFKEVWDFQVITNYMQTSEADETFRAIEFGLGIAYRLIDTRKFLLRADANFLGVPFSRYEVGNKFQVNSYGYTLGAGVNASFFFNQNWGIEAFGGVYYTKMLNFDAPSPFKNIGPSFYGNRLGVGVNYSY